MENIVINFDGEIGPGLTKALDILEKLGAVSKKDADAFRALSASGQQFAQGQDNVQKELTETEKKLSQVHTQTQKTGASLNEVGKKTGDGLKLANRDLGALNSAVTGIGSAIAGAFAVQQVIAFGAASVQAFQEAERNAVKLRSAVSVNGGLQGDFEELVKQSNELQKISIFSDDSIQQAQTAALQFGLTKDQVAALIPVVADFASATGQDLSSALDNILLGINGSERALKRYGVTVDENGTRSSRLGEITDQLTKKFDGQAVVIGKTAFGAAEKYKNELDDIQERLGERLSPILSDIRAQFLTVADGAITAAEAINSVFASSEIDISALTNQAFKINSETIAEASKAFRSLSDGQIEDKINVLTDALKQAREEAKGLNAEQAQSANQRIQEYATQITALVNIQAARKAGVDTIEAEKVALNQLKDISKLTDEQLKSLLKTFKGFTSIEASDAADKITKELDLRAKAGAKTIQDKEKNIAQLHALEQKASDRLLAVKAAEVDKIAELEQQKQQELRDLVSAAGKVSGADIAPILIEFEQSGITDIEKTIEQLQKAKFSTDEIDKFTQAVSKTNTAFDDLIEKEKLAQSEINIKINLQNVQDDFEDLKDVLENLQTEEEIEIRTKFIQEGDFSTEAFEKLQKDIEAIQQRTTDKIIEQAKRMGVDQKTIDALVLANKEENSKKAVDLAQETADEEVRIAKEKADKINEITNQIADLSRQAIDLIQEATNNYYNNRVNSIDKDLEETLDSYDRQAQANDDLHDNNKRGDREYENQRKKIDAERQKAEEKADRERKRLLSDQAKANKAFAVMQATINLAMSISAALSTVPPASYAFAALNAVLAGAELAAVIATPVPSFYKGVEKVTGKGTETSDEVRANLSVGERVVRASTNRKYFPILSAIHREKFDPESMNVLSKYSPETIRAMTQVDPKVIKELSVMQPVFLQHLPALKFRDDIVPQLQARYGNVIINNPPADPGITEYDMKRALKDGTPMTNTKELAREIAEAVANKINDPYSIHRK